MFRIFDGAVQAPVRLPCEGRIGRSTFKRMKAVKPMSTKGVLSRYNDVSWHRREICVLSSNNWYVTMIHAWSLHSSLLSGDYISYSRLLISSIASICLIRLRFQARDA